MLAGQYLPAWMAAGGEGAPAFMLVLCLPLVWVIWSRADRVPADNTDLAVALIVALIYCLPVQTLGWLLWALLVAYLWLRNDGSARTALAVAVVTALTVPFTELGLKWFARPLLSADAWLAAGILKLITGFGSSEENLISGRGSHALVVLHGCSLLHNLGGACLGWWTLHTFAGTSGSRAGLIALPFIAVLVVCLNLARLCLMAVDPTWHHWWHVGPGVTVYQGLSTAVPLLAALYSLAVLAMLKHLSALVVVILLSIALTVRVAAVSKTTAQVTVEQDIHRFLARFGPQPAERVSHADDGSIRGMQSFVPACGGYLQIAPLSPGTEMIGVFELRAQSLRYELKYLFNRQLFNSFEVLPFWWETWLQRLAYHLRRSDVEGTRSGACSGSTTCLRRVRVDALASAYLSLTPFFWKATYVCTSASLRAWRCASHRATDGCFVRVCTRAKCSGQRTWQ